jgi:hypothetical protein
MIGATGSRRPEVPVRQVRENQVFTVDSSTRMKKIGLAQLVGIVSNLAVLAGIALLAYELRQNTLVTELAVAQNYSDSLTAIDYFIAGDASFAPLLSRVATDPNVSQDDFEPEEWTRLLAFWRAQLREWDSAYTLFVVSDLNADMAVALRQQVVSILSVDPFIYNRWKEIRGTLTEPFNEMVEDVAAELGLQ